MVNFYEIDRFVGKQVQIEIWQDSSLIQLLDWLKLQNRNVENFYEHFNCEGYENPLYPVYVNVKEDLRKLYLYFKEDFEEIIEEEKIKDE